MAPYLGKLCRRGHDHEGSGMSLRDSSGRCRLCRNSKARERNLAAPEVRSGIRERYNKKPAAKAKSRAYRQSNKEVYLENTRRYRENNPERVEAARLQRLYGLSLAEKEKMLAAQGGVCACCGSTNDGYRRSSTLAVDHDHNTGQIRGLLCHACNLGIGNLGDNLQGVYQAVNYLQKRQPYLGYCI